MTASEHACWRITQQESRLALPCHPSEGELWAESRFLDIDQELRSVINDKESSASA
jgi:hypothetical protein